MPGVEAPRIPEGLRDLMKKLTKQVLREKPTNVYEFSAKYFESIINEKRDFAVKDFEPITSYEGFLKNRECNQIPMSLIYTIMPQGLTELLKGFIKAVLKEKPKNICEFAVIYFRGLQKIYEDKTLKYTAYERYFQNKEKFSFSTQLTTVKCVCGRTLNEGIFQRNHQKFEENSEIPKSKENETAKISNKIHSNDEHLIDTQKQKINNEEKATYNEKYLIAIQIIQRFIRRNIKKRKAREIKEIQNVQIVQQQPIESTKSEGELKKHSLAERQTLDVEMAVVIIQRMIRKYQKQKQKQKHKDIEKLQKQEEINDNNSDAASYTSASTALLSSANSTYENTPFEFQQIIEKSIQEDKEYENDRSNFNFNENKMAKMAENSRPIEINEHAVLDDIKSISKQNSEETLEVSSPTQASDIEQTAIKENKNNTQIIQINANANTNSQEKNNEQDIEMNVVNVKENEDLKPENVNTKSPTSNELVNGSIIATPSNNNERKTKVQNVSKTAENNEEFLHHEPEKVKKNNADIINEFESSESEIKNINAKSTSFDENLNDVSDKNGSVDKQNKATIKKVKSNEKNSKEEHLNNNELPTNKNGEAFIGNEPISETENEKVTHETIRNAVNAKVIKSIENQLVNDKNFLVQKNNKNTNGQVETTEESKEPKKDIKIQNEKVTDFNKANTLIDSETGETTTENQSSEIENVKLNNEVSETVTHKLVSKDSETEVTSKTLQDLSNEITETEHKELKELIQKIEEDAIERILKEPEINIRTAYEVTDKDTNDPDDQNLKQNLSNNENLENAKKLNEIAINQQKKSLISNDSKAYISNENHSNDEGKQDSVEMKINEDCNKELFASETNEKSIENNESINLEETTTTNVDEIKKNIEVKPETNIEIHKEPLKDNDYDSVDETKSVKETSESIFLEKNNSEIKNETITTSVNENKENSNDNQPVSISFDLHEGSQTIEDNLMNMKLKQSAENNENLKQLTEDLIQHEKTMATSVLQGNFDAHNQRKREIQNENSVAENNSKVIDYKEISPLNDSNEFEKNMIDNFTKKDLSNIIDNIASEAVDATNARQLTEVEKTDIDIDIDKLTTDSLIGTEIYNENISIDQNQNQNQNQNQKLNSPNSKTKIKKFAKENDIIINEPNSNKQTKNIREPIAEIYLKSFKNLKLDNNNERDLSANLENAIIQNNNTISDNSKNMIYLKPESPYEYDFEQNNFYKNGNVTKSRSYSELDRSPTYMYGAHSIKESPRRTKSRSYTDLDRTPSYLYGVTDTPKTTRKFKSKSYNDLYRTPTFLYGAKIQSESPKPSRKIPTSISYTIGFKNNNFNPIQITELIKNMQKSEELLEMEAPPQSLIELNDFELRNNDDNIENKIENMEETVEPLSSQNDAKNDIDSKNEEYLLELKTEIIPILNSLENNLRNNSPNDDDVDVDGNFDETIDSAKSTLQTILEQNESETPQDDKNMNPFEEQLSNDTNEKSVTSTSAKESMNNTEKEFESESDSELTSTWTFGSKDQYEPVLSDELMDFDESAYVQTRARRSLGSSIENDDHIGGVYETTKDPIFKVSKTKNESEAEINSVEIQREMNEQPSKFTEDEINTETENKLIKVRKDIRDDENVKAKSETKFKKETEVEKKIKFDKEIEIEKDCEIKGEKEIETEIKKKYKVEKETKKIKVGTETEVENKSQDEKATKVEKKSEFDKEIEFEKNFKMKGEKAKENVIEAENKGEKETQETKVVNETKNEKKTEVDKETKIENETEVELKNEVAKEAEGSNITKFGKEIETAAEKQIKVKNEFDDEKETKVEKDTELEKEIKVKKVPKIKNEKVSESENGLENEVIKETKVETENEVENETQAEKKIKVKKNEVEKKTDVDKGNEVAKEAEVLNVTKVGNKTKVGKEIETAAEKEVKVKNEFDDQKETKVEKETELEKVPKIKDEKVSESEIGLENEVIKETKVETENEVENETQAEKKIKVKKNEVEKKTDVDKGNEVAKEAEVLNETKVGNKTKVGKEIETAAEKEVKVKNEFDDQKETEVEKETKVEKETELEKEIKVKKVSKIKDEKKTGSKVGSENKVEKETEVLNEAKVGNETKVEKKTELKKEIEVKKVPKIKDEKVSEAEVGSENKVKKETQIETENEVENETQTEKKIKVKENEVEKKTEVDKGNEVAKESEVLNITKVGNATKIEKEIETKAEKDIEVKKEFENDKETKIENKTQVEKETNSVPDNKSESEILKKYDVKLNESDKSLTKSFLISEVEFWESNIPLGHLKQASTKDENCNLKSDEKTEVNVNNKDEIDFVKIKNVTLEKPLNVGIERNIDAKIEIVDDKFEKEKFIKTESDKEIKKVKPENESVMLKENYIKDIEIENRNLNKVQNDSELQKINNSQTENSYNDNNDVIIKYESCTENEKETKDENKNSKIKEVITKKNQPNIVIPREKIASEKEIEKLNNVDRLIGAGKLENNNSFNDEEYIQLVTQAPSPPSHELSEIDDESYDESKSLRSGELDIEFVNLQKLANATIIIQKWFRKLNRTQLLNKSNNKINDEKQIKLKKCKMTMEEAAATIIQENFRDHLVRKESKAKEINELNVELSSLNKNSQNAKNLAALKIQKAYRNYLAVKNKNTDISTDTSLNESSQITEIYIEKSEGDSDVNYIEPSAPTLEEIENHTKYEKTKIDWLIGNDPIETTDKDGNSNNVALGHSKENQLVSAPLVAPIDNTVENMVDSLCSSSFEISNDINSNKIKKPVEIVSAVETNAIFTNNKEKYKAENTLQSEDDLQPDKKNNMNTIKKEVSEQIDNLEQIQLNPEHKEDLVDMDISKRTYNFIEAEQRFNAILQTNFSESETKSDGEKLSETKRKLDETSPNDENVSKTDVDGKVDKVVQQVEVLNGNKDIVTDVSVINVGESIENKENKEKNLNRTSSTDLINVQDNDAEIETKVEESLTQSSAPHDEDMSLTQISRNNLNERIHDFIQAEKNFSASEKDSAKPILENISSKEKSTLDVEMAVLVIQRMIRKYQKKKQEIAKQTTPTVSSKSEIEKYRDYTTDFLDRERKHWESDIPYEQLRQNSLNKEENDNYSKNSTIEIAKNCKSSDEETDGGHSSDDNINILAERMRETNETVRKMQFRQSLETKEKSIENNDVKELSFEEPNIKSIQELQVKSTKNETEDEPVVVLSPFQREDTRESSTQSGSAVTENDEDEIDDNVDDLPAMKGTLKRLHTIAGDQPKSLLKSVTIDETLQFDSTTTTTTDNLDEDSFALDDATSANIREKMMAFSLSEADSDYVEGVNNFLSSSLDRTKMKIDDFNVSTALVDTSTETESTIISAATKIQAIARAFLIRRRLKRASEGTKSSTAQQDSRASFGNDAITESLEQLIQDEAAKKIQNAFRRHVYQKQKTTQHLKSSNSPTKHISEEDEAIPPTHSMESSLAARRLTLQRNDALKYSSNPDDESINNNNNNNKNNNTNNNINDKNSAKTHNAESKDELHNEIENGMIQEKDIALIPDAVKSKPERNKKTMANKLKWFGLRQNSMPVQIESEVLRVIPKHMRKRIKSAEGQKKGYRHIPKNF